MSDSKWGYLEEETRFIDGGKYKGTWNVLGMEGTGEFVSPHGTAFQGEFRDGTFHGHGSTHWPRGQRVDGIWSKGECKGRRYIFEDGLIYLDHGWKYCQFPDRRYLSSLENGLKPAGATSRTNHRDAFFIPPMCYDCGIGIFNPRTHCVASYRDTGKILQIPSTEEAEWIKKNCRKAWSAPTGDRKDLYENWFSDNFDGKILSPLRPFSKESPEPWWERLSNIRREITRAPGSIPLDGVHRQYADTATRDP